MTETTVRIPLPLAMDLDLEDRWHMMAEQEGLSYDGGEETGQWMLHFFPDTPVERVEKFARLYLPKRGGLTVSLTGPREVTISGPVTWLIPLNVGGRHPYERALKAESNKVSNNSIWQEWWSESGYTTLMFHIMDPRGVTWDASHPWEFEPDPLGGPGLAGKLCVDLSVLADEHPPRGAGARFAREHLKILLDGLAEYLDRPRPALPW